jgi:predicted hydrocarbon binding protein
VDDQKTVTNMAIRAAYDSLGEVMGENARKIILKGAGLQRVLDTPPDYTFDREFTNHEQAAVYRETIKLVGPVGSQGILRQMGYKNVETAVVKYHVLDSLTDLPPAERIVKCFEFSQSVLNKGRVTIDDRGLPTLDVFDCLTCDGVTSEKPFCSQYGGGLQFMADFSFGKGKYRVIESRCKAMGHESCLFSLVAR